MAAQQLGVGYALAGAVQATVTAVGKLDARAGSLSLRVLGTGLWTYQFSRAYLHSIASAIAGKSPQQATAILMHLPGVSQVTLHISGVSTTTLPADPGRIHLLVLSQWG